MATQGIVSVVIGERVAVKAVAGSNGMQADLLAAEIERRHITSPEEIFALAKEVEFGEAESLVVQAPNRNLYEGSGDLPAPYVDRSKFENAEFNPRWEKGTADHVRIVKFEG